MSETLAVAPAGMGRARLAKARTRGLPLRAVRFMGG